ncbi:MAG TPA: helix-turn-helix domain-containing protein [Ktedonobacteraceae bacterium]|jgi:excisionase family DNA binding protein|nr:helix-turn-helix domain-containing protein [Ktedonobacteraceae bacterium]
MTQHTEDEWLSLKEAAEMLGMHPATVRLWADRNELPSRRTNGGHRRFRRADIEARLRQDEERKPRPAAQLLVQSVLGRIRFAFTDGTLDTFPWYTHFNEEAREGYRRLGRRVLELLLHALTDHTSAEELRAGAVQLGKEYGSITRASSVPVADAVRAFLYFRSLIDESLLQLAEVQGGGREHQDIPWIESLYQIQAITNEILPALIEAALEGTNHA